MAANYGVKVLADLLGDALDGLAWAILKLFLLAFVVGGSVVGLIVYLCMRGN